LIGRTEENFAEPHLEQSVYYSYPYKADVSDPFMAEYLQRVYVPHTEIKRKT